MHDTTKDEETKQEVIDTLDTYFDLSSLKIEDLGKKISEINFDESDT